MMWLRDAKRCGDDFVKLSRDVAMFFVKKVVRMLSRCGNGFVKRCNNVLSRDMMMFVKRNGDVVMLVTRCCCVTSHHYLLVSGLQQTIRIGDSGDTNIIINQKLSHCIQHALGEEPGFTQLTRV